MAYAYRIPRGSGDLVNFTSLMLQSEIYDFLNELFLSTEIWGWFGPTILVIVGLYFVKSDRFLGIIMIILMSLFAWYYFENAPATPGFYWHGFIIVLGIISCFFIIATRR